MKKKLHPTKMKLDAEELLLDRELEKGNYIESTELEFAETKKLLEKAAKEHKAQTC
jgi:hypothetical protein